MNAMLFQEKNILNKERGLSFNGKREANNHLSQHCTMKESDEKVSSCVFMLVF